MKKQYLIPVLFFPVALAAQTPDPLPAQDTIMKKDTLLKEVIVTHRKPLLTHAIDRTIVNVDAMISAATSNALEVLGKTPGVTVDQNSVLSLNGRSGVQVLINGRPTYLSAPDLAAYLRSLPGSSIDKIELIENPPARYDASGSALINLQLKRSSIMGINGQLSSGYSQGNYPRSNQGLNLTYYTPRLRWYNNLGYNTETSFTRDRSERTYQNEDLQPEIVQLLENKTIFKRKTYGIQSGVDYTLNAKTTLGMLARYNYGTNNDRIDFQLDKIPATFRQQQQRRNLALNMNILTKLDAAGRELSGEFNYMLYNSKQDQEMNDFNLYLPTNMKVLTFNTDYIHPLGKKAKLEAGYKASYVRSTNRYDYTPVNTSQPGWGEKESFPFDFEETIQAGYISGQQKWKRLGVQLGLRAEYTNNNGFGKSTSGGVGEVERFRMDYLKLFPTLNLSYQLDSAGHNNLVLMANRRINRPNYYLMNPYILYADRYNYNQGNPFLQPQIMDRYEIKFMRKQWLQTAFAYSRFKGVIFPVARVQDSVVIRRNENVALGQMFILNNQVTQRINKWWNLQTSIRVLYAWLEGKDGHPTIDAGALMMRINLRNDFNFSETWQAEFGGSYNSRDINVQSFTKSIFECYGSIQKKILKSKGSIRLSVEDIFRSWVYRNRSFGLEQLAIDQRLYADSQRFGLAFTWSFGKKSIPKKSRNLEQAGEERNRL